MNVVLYFLYIGLITSTMLFLGAFVYRGANKSKSATIFGVLSVITAFWVFANSYVANFRGSSFTTFAAIADLLIALPLVGVYWYFVDSFFELNQKRSKTVYFMSKLYIPIASLLAAVLVLGGKIITFSSSTPIEIYYSSLFDIYSFIIGSIFLFTIVRLIVLIRRSKIADRSQYKHLLLGISIAGLSLLFSNLLIPLLSGGDNRFATNISYIGLLIFIGLTARAIIVHRLFNARLLVAKSIAYALSIFMVATIFIVSTLIFGQLLVEEKIPIAIELFFAVISIITAFLFQPIKKFFDKFTNSIFYRDAYNPQEVINKINSTLVNTLQLEKLLNSTAAIIETELKTQYVNFYLESKASIEFHLAGSNTKIFASDSWNYIEAMLEEREAKTLVITESGLSEQNQGKLRSIRVESIVKMISNNENVGYLVVGDRKSGTAFTDNDIQLLEIIADEVAIAVQNALRFEEISQFNVTLQQKIDDATRLLQKSNEKLKALDEAKDEFISMASHQLRTPLTSVKGYISMILEGDAGKVTPTQQKFLDQAFISSQRMVYLIADLLNVSRLKTGKFVIESHPTYLPDVVESEIQQLYETAKSRELELVFDKPKEYPTLNLDETKTRQVIMNFVDNAIYYTPRGGKITVALNETKDTIEYTVTDTGIGVPKSEQHHLFTKFYRAGNARQARPDGTGLGLFMAKKVVVAQGGAIIFKTTEGKGSTFGFSFPLAKLEVTDTDPKEDKET